MSVQAEETPAEWALPRGVIVLLGLAGAVVAIAGLQAFSGIAGPAFLALMLTVAVSPIGTWMKRKGAPGWLATITTMGAAFGILIAFALAMVYAAVRLAELLPTYASSADDLTKTVSDWLSGLGVTESQIKGAMSNVQLSDVSGVLLDLASSITSALSNMTFIVILLFFMGLDLAAFNDRLRVSKFLRPDIGTAFESFVTGTRSYLIVATVFGLIVAVIDAGALWALGIPLPMLWGIVSFITNYIPNIGFVIGVIPPALIALLDGGFGLMVTVVVVYSVINFVIQSLIQPKFVGDSVGLATTVTFLSMVIWTWIIGPLGALLAVPLTLLTKAMLIDIDPSTRWIGNLLGSGRPPPPEDADDADDAPPSGDEPVVAPAS
jgi:predicted PurR-regulated permease PerM